MRAWSVVVLVALFATVGLAEDVNDVTIEPHWSIEGGMGLGDQYEGLLLGAAMYWPGPDDGAVGVMVAGGEPVAENEFAAGPCVEWPLGPMVATVAEAVLPDTIALALGQWANQIESLVSQLTGPVRPYTRAALLFDRQVDPTGAWGSALRFRADKAIQPVLRYDYFKPAGNTNNSALKGGWFSLNMMYRF